MSPFDISVSFPSEGVIRLRSRSLFDNAANPGCRLFLERIFQVDEISNVSITGGDSPQADLYYCARKSSVRSVVKRVVALLGQGAAGNGEAVASGGADEIPAQGQANTPSSRSHRAEGEPSSEHDDGGCFDLEIAPVSSLAIEEDDRCTVLFYRQDSRVLNWQVKSDLPGRVRLKNPVLFRKKGLCQAIERELTGVLGIDRFSTNSLTSTVLIHFDRHELTKTQVMEIVDAALARAEQPEGLDKPDMHLGVCTASLPLAAAAQFASAPLLPAAAVLYAFTSIPTLREARRVFVEEKRIGVDALDAVVMVGCLGTMSIFPGAVCCWCLSFGRYLVKKTRDSSQKLLLNALGKQPKYAWLCRGASEVQVSADRLEKGDIIVVHTGEVVPVDGHVVEGMALVDQHALTGESTPAEKGTGDQVFASTLLVAGEIRVTVEMSGSETASAKISQILSDTAGYKMSSQHKGERLADKAVLPTLGAGALGWAMLGPVGAVAVLNSDLGTGIRMAVPLAMLSSLTLCASKGVLIKDGRALEIMNQVDTVLFDKTGTLTRERPVVRRVIAGDGWEADRILGFAAAAERKFHHPIALAILDRARELGLNLPRTDDSHYKVGYGITVQIDGHTVRVGSKRFIESERIPISGSILEALNEAHLDGHTMVMIGVDDCLGGAIELEAAVRPEAYEIVRGLRERGIKHLAIISGDHDAPTRKLALSLGMDRYFAQVLPADKADYVAKLQEEGRIVCFVGDGINDSIALKKADVSISLRGASSIATDTAQIVFLEGGLSKLCELRDIARDLDRNVNRSWSMIVAPNVTNVVGVFTMGFGIMTSVITNNVAALFALANGLLPLRKVARAEAERKGNGEEKPRAEPAGRDLVPTPPLAVRRRRADAGSNQHRVLTESA